MHDPKELSALGFGVDALLMNDPKIFIDRRFLASLLFEFETELGAEDMRAALFRIGLGHGFRDAHRIVQAERFDDPVAVCQSAAGSTSLLMRLAAPAPLRQPGAIEILGEWPESREAEARLSKLGPSTNPSCFLSAGYTSGWLSGTHDIDIVVGETECAAAGAERCSFRAQEAESWRAQRQFGILEIARPTSFATVRGILAHGHVATDLVHPPSFQEACFDPDDSAVHIWGPVMVLPFTNADQALNTVGMLSRDPGTGGIRVVVIDLRNEVVDEGFAAAGLEQLLESIEAWGAEIILTGVSPFSEAVVSELEATHLLTRKDLPEAIASGFQIAEAQRHLL